MLARLGYVLYWSANAASAAAFALGCYLISQPPSNGPDRMLPLFFALAALMIWLAGRALRFVLAGR